MKQQMASSNSSTLRTSSSSSLSSSRNVNEVSNYAHRSSYIKAAAAAAAPSSRRSVTPTSRSHSSLRQNDDNDSGRVRVAVRLRPRNAEDLISDADSFDCVELQPEMRRLKLRKNNWSSESYRFDDIFTESASQKRVYEAVAKPVVESVLNGYNGTVMAYGQTGTGKTYTVGRLGKNDASERGIVVRALEDVIANTSPDTDVVEMSYLQLYMESIQDLLAPEKINIPINEDPRTGEVSLPGATIVRVRDLDNLFELLQIGEMNRHAANTKQNTESSRSHAILMVYVRRSIHQKLEDETTSQDSKSDLPSSNGIPRVRKGKLLIVDLAGSERLDKSGSEGHLLEEAKFINLSLTSLGKCINALAENSPHIPTRDSKLTRLLRDSFGGSARTSLIITIGPSSRHHAETTSTIMFGQRAMKIVNMVKLKEEFDYESLSRKLGTQLDHLTAEIERELKLRDIEKRHLEKQLNECQDSFAQTKKHLVARSEFLEQENARLELEMKEMLNELDHRTGENGLMHDKVQLLELRLKESQQHQLENSTYQKVLADTTQMYERKIAEINKKFEDEHACYVRTDEELYVMKQLLSDCQKSNKQLEVENSMYLKVLEETRQLYEKKTAELSKQLEDEHARFEGLEEQLDQANKLLSDGQDSIEDLEEIEELKGKLQEMYQLHDNTINELQSLKSDKKDLLQEKTTLIEELCDLKRRLLVEEKQRKSLEHELAKLKKSAPESDSAFECIQDKQSYTKENISKSYKSNPSRETLSSQRVTIAKICEEVGLQKILQLLASEDSDVQIHAVKVIANLAAEEINQEKIVEEGGLDALLMLLKSSQNATILRVASGAIANLAMNEMNQGLIMSKGGAQLLAKTASKTDDPQTLRMVAGALANLCGNVSLHMMLKEDGAIKALLEMAKSKSIDVIAQVARGMANFAKCESRGTLQGQRKGRSLLIEDDALEWLIANSNSTSSSTRRHVELALCHLAQNEDNVKDFISSGGTKELVRISVESSREDIRNLAKKTLKLSPSFETEAKELIILERCSS
ncbi:kinesin-like protein KIN-UC isoform X4 [Ricinus communis]|uniref:kinesin-like protein KIN-UC isoform X4 n=1 Tax=Ricinus communis TaxID=3988 RepID=UPI000772B076|nr:kinesin-like protein KIN-UC isoform X4 [Ricinus communis]|eukprot:XP_015581130.1 kinesin-like protein KIN-UC isoform X4 [Ricinus communis]